MVRFCIVDGCKESDLTTLTHRFPKKVDRWRESLNVYQTEDLRNKVVCCHHFRESDYSHRLSNFLNRTAVPKVHVPENERRNNRVEHPVQNPLPEAQPQRMNPDNQMEIYIELESGDQIAFQTTKTVPLISRIPTPENVHQPVKRQRLEDPSEEFQRVNEKQEDSTLPSPAESQEPVESSTNQRDVIKDPDGAQELDEVEKQLRDHYSNFTKAELINFLVKLRVFLK